MLRVTYATERTAFTQKKLFGNYATADSADS